jgi:hypothetical protein
MYANVGTYQPHRVLVEPHHGALKKRAWNLNRVCLEP